MSVVATEQEDRLSSVTSAQRGRQHSPPWIVRLPRPTTISADPNVGRPYACGDLHPDVAAPTACNRSRRAPTGGLACGDECDYVTASATAPLAATRIAGVCDVGHRRWRLNQRAERGKYAVVVAGGEGIMAITAKEWQKHGGRCR